MCDEHVEAVVSTKQVEGDLIVEAYVCEFSKSTKVAKNMLLRFGGEVTKFQPFFWD